MKKFIFKLLYKINNKLYYRCRYYITRRKILNFDNPSNLSEYILSAMTKPQFIEYAQYADKVKVRDYVISKGLEHTLPACFGVWDNASKINFDELPNRFALKTNHGCGSHVICADKSMLDVKKSIASLNKTLSNIFDITEPHYKYIEPLVFAEEFIDDGSGALPTDYKFMCVNGKPMCILVCTEREGLTAVKHTYSLDWKLLSWTTHKVDAPIVKPQHLEEMIGIAKKLSEDFDFVRVDLYDCKDRVIFGELTFSPAQGLLQTFTLEALEVMNPSKI